TRHRAAAAAALVVLVLLAAPYLRFRYVLHPEMMDLHLEDLQSYWTEERPTTAKLGTFANTYLRGLSPAYWVVEDSNELDRHRMLGSPHLPLWLAPAVLIGLGVSLVRSPRSAPHRLVLIGVLAAPFSAALVSLRITRVLAMVVPATILATVGLDRLRAWLARTVPERALAAVVGIGLAAATLVMTRDALVHGPRWFTNYGMHGMQWGARELFAEVRRRLAADPEERVVISHLWANNTNAFGDFFLSAEQNTRIGWGVLDDVLRDRRHEVAPTTSFALTPAEFARAQASPKLRVEPGWTVIPDPAGNPGFLIARLAYTPEADELFEVERAERRRPVEGTVMIDGAPVGIRHPRLDLGVIGDAFDGDLGSLARTLDANPGRLELRFPGPRPVRELRLHLWAERYHVRVRATRADGTIVSETVQADLRLEPGPLTLRLPEPLSDVLELDLTIAKAGDVHLHLREIEILP
ncbi:MAG TPA: hypothetical protein VLA75_02240, partial [Thermoanaerobaculia bacterium]|nr:hypothetical protein [Thermoanaerobaculia bacterium]